MTLSDVLMMFLLVLAGSAITFLFVKSVRTAVDQSERPITDLRKPEAMPVDPKLEWLPEDVEALRQFLNTPTGQKLSRNSRAMIAASCMNSCADVMHTAHSAGVGHGMNEFFRWYQSLASDQMLQTLSAPSSVTAENDTSEGYGQASLLEKLSP